VTSVSAWTPRKVGSDEMVFAAKLLPIAPGPPADVTLVSL
jgi:hypothetical protein